MRDSLVFETLMSNALARVLIDLHGCNGLESLRHEQLWNRLAAMGFLIVMTDSFARHQRGEECGRQPAWVYATRAMELEFAQQQIVTFASPTPQEVFVFGHSEAAIAVVWQFGHGMTAAMVTGTGCLRFELTVLMLAVMSKNDRALHGKTCRQASQRLLLEGALHGVLSDVSVQQTIFGFLNAHKRP